MLKDEVIWLKIEGDIAEKPKKWGPLHKIWLGASIVLKLFSELQISLGSDFLSENDIPSKVFYNMVINLHCEKSIDCHNNSNMHVFEKENMWIKNLNL